MFVGNGLMAILAGLIANYLVTDMKLGPVAPFDASAVVLLIEGAVILSTWGRWRQACRAVRWGRWSSECISAPLPSPRPFSLLPSAGENYGDSKHQHSLGHQFKMAGAAIMGGKCDPLVELTTDGKFTAETKCLKSTDHPVWGETFWLVVQVGPRQGAGKGCSTLLSGRSRARDHILMAVVSLLLQSFNQAIGHF